jgi:hypothetical protein
MRVSCFSMETRACLGCSRQHSSVGYNGNQPSKERSAIPRCRREDDRQELSTETDLRVQKVSKMLAVATLSLLVAESDAVASEWYPRRHHRRLQTQSRLDKLILKNNRRTRRKEEQEKKVRLQQEQEELDVALKEAKLKDDVLLQSMESIKKVFGKHGDSVTPSYSVGVKARPPPSAYYGHSIRQRDSPLPIGMSLVWGLVAFGVFWFLKNTFGWTFPGRGGRQGGKQGRWVRDRSLGGRMVFIEDSAKAPRPLWDDLPGEEELQKTKTVPGYLSDTDEDDAPSGPAKNKTMTPVWWAPPEPVSYVSANRRQELQKQADSLVRQLQNQKIELGQDYSLRGLVDLRMTCNNGGGLSVTASTQSGRDSMLRMALKHSLENPKSSLGGYEPSRFVSGIATDLNVPQDRAITIVHAEIASICRNALIDAEASFRSQDERLLSRSLLKIIHALQSFPIPPGSPEMEMVGRSIMRTTSLEFRKAVFFTAGAADLSIAPVVAEIVGFDPALVMPQLLMQIQTTQDQQTD